MKKILTILCLIIGVNNAQAAASVVLNCKKDTGSRIPKNEIRFIISIDELQRAWTSFVVNGQEIIKEPLEKVNLSPLLYEQFDFSGPERTRITFLQPSFLDTAKYNRTKIYITRGLSTSLQSVFGEGYLYRDPGQIKFVCEEKGIDTLKFLAKYLEYDDQNN